MKFPLFHNELVIPTLLSLYLFIQHQSLEDKTILLIFIANIIAINCSILWFLHGVIDEITDHLGIYCFTLRKRVKNE